MRPVNSKVPRRRCETGRRLRGPALAFFGLLLPALLHRPVYARPMQLMESDSAILMLKGHLGVTTNYIHESGYIPTQAARVKLRYGIFSWLEGYGDVTGVRFREQDENRIASASTYLKSKLWTTNAYGFNSYLIAKYKHKFGDPFIVPFDGQDDPDLENVSGVISPYVDGGRDISGGILARSSVLIGSRRWFYFMSFIYTRAEGRQFGDFTDEQKNQYHFMIAPEYHPGKWWMLALENRVMYWPGRGTTYEMVPQIRWEFIPYWLLELGGGVPVVGGNNYRLIVGFKFSQG